MSVFHILPLSKVNTLAILAKEPKVSHNLCNSIWLTGTKISKFYIISKLYKKSSKDGGEMLEGLRIVNIIIHSP